MCNSTYTSISFQISGIIPSLCSLYIANTLLQAL